MAQGYISKEYITASMKRGVYYIFTGLSNKRCERPETNLFRGAGVKKITDPDGFGAYGRVMRPVT